ECTHFVADEIASCFRQQPVHVIGFGGCYPNEHADKAMNALCTHPNVGAVLLLSLGCESFDRKRLHSSVSASGRPVKTIVVQQAGGTLASVEEGKKWIEAVLPEIRETPKVPVSLDEL